MASPPHLPALRRAPVSLPCAPSIAVGDGNDKSENDSSGLNSRTVVTAARGDDNGENNGNGEFEERGSSR
ncbi:hypothetical protein E2562_017816 [Oryza meyeriana var. granulata]|uniref:Uncharacterized protein n=1 Tax=Oryza meyeriana var. granulata TaxID=110450 RepID=A0A6G1BLS3_9ORYZ|nr:hypothetical protein E2562_017816 [Oryza meyeriana var. granulata]